MEFDFNDSEKIKKEISILYKENISLDILINNAGIASGSILEMTSIDSLKNTFEINFFSQIKITQLLIKLLKKSNSSSIINIGSISGLLSERGTLSYATSKSAFMHATKIIAKELSIYNIRVNAIAPNVTKTDMLRKMDKKSIKKMLKRTSRDKPYSVNDVAKVVMFLASEKSKNINGKILRVEKFLKNDEKKYKKN